MITIGVTGGIGCGKSTVSQYLINKGFNVIDADLVAREIVEPYEPAYCRIIEKFGEKILQSDGRIDRKKLGEIVFKDKSKLAILNEITHKLIVEEIKKRIEILNKAEVDLLFIDAALLFETGLNNLLDEIWIIDVPEEIRIERIKRRDSITEKEIKARIENQMPRNQLLKLGTVIIDNSKEVEDLIKEIDQNLKRYAK